MAFIKAHLILLITGVATLGFIVIAVMGLMSDTVVKKMQERAGLGGQLSTLKGSPKNEESIAAERSRVSRLQSEYQEVLQAAEEINAHSPLLEAVFPTPQRAALAYDFCDAYRSAVRKLPGGKLAGGDLPSDAEVADAKEQLAELEERRRLEEGDLGPMYKRVDAAKGATPSAATPGPAQASAGSASGSGDPNKDPVARARITKARNIRCYVTTDPGSPRFGFTLSPLWASLGEPDPAEMWYAQVVLWIEQDVVAAIAGLNDEAARRLQPEEVYVENMPVKRLQTVSVLGYFAEKGLLPFPALTRVGGTSVVAEGGETFTGRRCNKDFDVVRFSVTAVVDQRDLPRLIDAITRQNFYQLVNASYEALGAAATDYRDGYFYGTAPVVRATLDFEGYMARKLYSKWFPPDVRSALGLGDDKGKAKGKPDKGKAPPKPKPAPPKGRPDDDMP